MKIDSFDVYERPVAEEVNLVVESPIAGTQSGNMENPDDPGTEIPV